jgi:hypothetical protein
MCRAVKWLTTHYQLADDVRIVHMAHQLIDGLIHFVEGCYDLSGRGVGVQNLMFNELASSVFEGALPLYRNTTRK